MNEQRARRVIRLRRLVAHVAAWLPLNAVRVWSYRMLGYTIKDSLIGWRTVIAVERLSMSGASIGRHNKIVGPFSITMEKGAAIGSSNLIWCDFWPLDREHARFDYKREFFMGVHSVITNDHSIDVVDRIRIGAGTHVAGRRSQFWTHGYAGADRSIEIGVDCFVGSAVIMLPGARVGDRSTVGSGAVVSRKYLEPFCVIVGNPTSVLRTDYYWRTRSQIDPTDPPPLPEKLLRDWQGAVAETTGPSREG